jgi:hypothetical protein
MDEDIQRKLREPFPAVLVGKLPRIWCGACREARGKVCDKHTKVRCSDCGNNITSAHLHLDYVGHAEVTDRFLSVDPQWTWEPVAFGPDGLPAIDRAGGLWIRLTIAGVTRLGYGHADGKNGPDAVKEAIGDALRNAGMRFGVGLDLWGAKFKDPDPDAADHGPGENGGDSWEAAQPATARRAAPVPAAADVPAPADNKVTQEQHKLMHALWRALGFDGDANRETRLALTAKFLHLPSLDSSADLTYEQAETVIARLRDRQREMRKAAAA